MSHGHGNLECHVKYRVLMYGVTASSCLWHSELFDSSQLSLINPIHLRGTRVRRGDLPCSQMQHEHTNELTHILSSIVDFQHIFYKPCLFVSGLPCPSPALNMTSPYSKAELARAFSEIWTGR